MRKKKPSPEEQSAESSHKMTLRKRKISELETDTISDSPIPTASAENANASNEKTADVEHCEVPDVSTVNEQGSRKIARAGRKPTKKSKTALRKTNILNYFYQKSYDVDLHIGRLLELTGMTEEGIRKFFKWRKIVEEKEVDQLKNALLKNSISSDSDSSSDEEPKNGDRELELLRKVADGRKKLKPIQPEQKTNRKDSNIQPPPRKKFCQHYSRDMEMLDDREPRNFKGSTNTSKRTQPARGNKNSDFKEILEKINYHSDPNESSSSSEDDNSTDSEQDYVLENSDSDEDLNEDVPQNVEFDEVSKTTTSPPIQQIQPTSPTSRKSRNSEEVEKSELFVDYKVHMELYEKNKLLSEVIEIPEINGKETQENAPPHPVFNLTQHADGIETPEDSENLTEMVSNQENIVNQGPTMNQENRTTNSDVSILLPTHNLPNLKCITNGLVMVELKTMERGEKFSNAIIDHVLRIYIINSLDENQWDSIWLADCDFFDNLQFASTTKYSSERLNFSKRHPEGHYKIVLMKNCENLQWITEDVDIFSKKLLIIPVNHENHWILSVIMNPLEAFSNSEREKDLCKILIFDSLENGSERRRHISHVLTEWLKKTKEVKKVSGSFNRLRIPAVEALNLPRQQELNDCGPFVCFFGQKVIASLSSFNKHMNLPFDWKTICPTSAPADIRQETIDLVLQQATSTFRDVIAATIGLTMTDKESTGSTHQESDDSNGSNVSKTRVDTNDNDIIVDRPFNGTTSSELFLSADYKLFAPEPSFPSNGNQPSIWAITRELERQNPYERSIEESRFVEIPRHTIPDKPSIFGQKNKKKETFEAKSKSMQLKKHSIPKWYPLLPLQANEDCSVNSIAHMLFSCNAIRSIFVDRSSEEPGKPLSNLLSRIFKKETDTARDWINSIAEETNRSGKQDIGDIIDSLLTPLSKETEIRPIQFETSPEAYCSYCRTSSYEDRQTHCFKVVTIKNNVTFKQMFAQNYGDTPSESKTCGHTSLLKNFIVPQLYHIMVIKHKIIDGPKKTIGSLVNFDSNEVVEMFRKKWILRAFVQYLNTKTNTSKEQKFSGPYHSWIRFENGWTCLNDMDVVTAGMEIMDLSQMRVKMLVFEQVMDETQK